MATVQRWTGAQTTALRQAMRLSIRAFAAHLGVDARTVNKWEARGATITLLPDNQALMDTALRRASEEVKTRFTQAADSSTPELRTLAPSAALNDVNESSHPLTELAGLLLAHLAATSAGTAGPTDQETHAHQLADYLATWAANVNRRGLLYLLPGIAGGYPVVTRTGSETTTPGLDVHPVEHFQQMRKVLMDNDNMFGARSVVLSVQEQISTLQRLRQDYRGVDRQKLLHVQTQFADLCGWLYQDSGDYHAAAYWLGRALELAHMCDDQDAIAFILARRSQLAADMGDPAEALDAAEAALRMAPQASGRVVTIATAFAAHGHALRRNGANCERFYVEAQDLFGRLETDPSCPWALLLDRSYIEVQRARSLTFLGEYGAAVDSFHRAIADLPCGYRRDRGVYLAREAIAHLGNGDADQASTVGLQALDIGAETRSARIIGELKHLDAALGKCLSSPSAADFQDAMNATFSPLELAGHAVQRKGD
ncbi:MAG: helix-turn-helix domain-containing protein [Pseudonocardiaceae bacterium]